MSDTFARQLPHDLAAEKAVLGSLLVNADLLALVVPILKAEQFFRAAHSTVFSAILALSEKNVPADLLTLKNHLDKAGQLDECGGPSYLSALTDGVPRSSNVEAYAKIVVDKWRLRQVIQTASDLMARAYDGEQDAETLVDAAGAALFALGTTTEHGTLEQVGPIVQRAYAILERHGQGDAGVVGLPTGFSELDRLIGGLKPQDLILLAARPSSGKSSMMLNIADHVASKGKTVAVFSLEMGKESLMLRLFAARANVDGGRMLRGTLMDYEIKRVVEAMSSISDLPMHVDETGGLTMFELRAKARALKRTSGLDLIALDYLQLMPGNPKAENRTIALGEISRALKMLAKELNVPMLALSQLNRGGEDRKDRTPQLSDLRGSGDLEQDADVVLFIHREELYKATEDNRGKAKLIIAKQRNGAIGTIELLFHQEQTRFADLNSREMF